MFTPTNWHLLVDQLDDYKMVSRIIFDFVSIFIFISSLMIIRLTLYYDNKYWGKYQIMMMTMDYDDDDVVDEDDNNDNVRDGNDQLAMVDKSCCWSCLNDVKRWFWL